MRRKYAPFIAAAALVIAIIIFAFSYSYSQKQNENKIKDATDYSTTEFTTSDFDGERSLLCENKEGNYQLYYYPETEKVLLVHGELEREFNWGWSVKIHIPEMAYYDVDDDGEKELLLRVAASTATDDVINSKPYAVFNLFVIEVVETDGVEELAAFMAGANTWRDPFKDAIKVEITQLKDSKKFIQVAMNNADVGISYDDIGLTNNKYTYYAGAYRDNKNRYYTLDTWNFNSGIYTFDEENEKMVLDISIIVQYEEEEFREYLGNIHCDITFSNGKFHLTPNTIVFVPMTPKIVTDPRERASQDWSVKLTNSAGAPSSSSKEINWIENQFNMNTYRSDTTLDFSALNSKIKCVDSIEISESGVIMTAKSGYTFSERVVENGTYTVTIEGDDGSSQQIDNTVTVKTDASGRSILTMNFDKTYDREDLKTLRIKFGV